MDTIDTIMAVISWILAAVSGYGAWASMSSSELGVGILYIAAAVGFFFLGFFWLAQAFDPTCPMD